MLNYGRLSSVAANMRRCGLSQILVSDDDSIFYLIGCRIKAQERCGVLLIREDEQVHAFMNELFCIPPVPGVIWHTYRDGEDVYGMIAAELHSGKVGFDKNWPSRHTISILEKREDIIPVLGSAPVDDARMRKDAKEQELLRDAGRINDLAIAYGLSHIAAAVTEAELAKQIDAFFLAHGGKQVGQYQVVCYGANAAQPHHMSDNTLPRPGDSVLIDLVCPINDYWCDMTRTVFYRQVSEQHRQVYEVVRRAQQAGIDFVRPGVRMSQIDAAVRQVIVDAGYGAAFITRTGHGIGLMVHEPPDVSISCDMVAQEGMVFSIEPGIYLPGDTGVRIEDLVLVTADGCEVLTHYPKELQIIS